MDPTAGPVQVLRSRAFCSVDTAVTISIMTVLSILPVVVIIIPRQMTVLAVVMTVVVVVWLVVVYIIATVAEIVVVDASTRGPIIRVGLLVAIWPFITAMRWLGDGLTVTAVAGLKAVIVVGVAVNMLVF